MEIKEEDAQSLGAKLEAMDLNAGERAALDAVFEAASDDEVAGFAFGAGKYSMTIGAVNGGEIGIAQAKGVMTEEITFKHRG